MLGENEFENGAGVVVEATDDFHVGFDLVFLAHGFEEVKDLVEFGDACLVGFVGDFEVVELLDYERTFAVKIDESEDFFDSFFSSFIKFCYIQEERKCARILERKACFILCPC